MPVFGLINYLKSKFLNTNQTIWLLYFSPSLLNPLLLQFPEMDEATVSFTIKEETPDETLWIRDSAGQVGKYKTSG